MDLARAVLDSQLVDRNGREMGKVDGIAIELRDDQPPRLAYIEQGGPVPWRRLHPRLGHLTEKLGQKWSVRGGVPFQIPWSKVRQVGIEVQVDLDAEGTPALAWEEWLRKHVIDWIPGAKGG